MQRFEHVEIKVSTIHEKGEVVTVDGEITDDAKPWNEELAEREAAGFEMVGVVPILKEGNTIGFIAFLKRPVQNRTRITSSHSFGNVRKPGYKKSDSGMPE